MADSNKLSQRKLAATLLCGLAMCFAVLYVTYDGDMTAEETVLASAKMPPSVYSVDVLKAGTVFTATPAGEMRLLDYFKTIEQKMNAEKARRLGDVNKINAMIARNAVINAQQRKRMKMILNKKINMNARRAQHALSNAMRRTQAQFQSAAKLANRRHRMMTGRFRAIRRTINANKRAAASQLKYAVLAQQRALAGRAASLNSRISRTNRRVSANSVQIKANAKYAAKALQRTMKQFNHKIHNVRREAAAGRSKLAAQLAAQDKKTRAWANNKIAGVVASTAAQFQSVRRKMVRDRKRANRLVNQSSQRMSAALSAQAALESRRFSKTLANISAARSESSRKLRAAKASFKTSMMYMKSVVKRQEGKMIARINEVAGSVERNRQTQNRVNRRMNAEMRRIVNIGNRREYKRLRANKRLYSVIKKNSRKTSSYLRRMRASFSARLGKLERYARQSRRMTSRQLSRATIGLYRTISRNQVAQNARNAAMQAATARARLDALDAVRRAKASFRSRLGQLNRKCGSIARKQSRQYSKLLGVVSRNAARSAKGRRQLRLRQDYMRNQLSNAINGAVRAGKRRAAGMILKMKSMNKRTRAVLNMKISSEITSLKSWTKRSLTAARIESAKARAAMKREMTFAISAARNEAKSNLRRAMGGIHRRMNRAARLAYLRSRASAKSRENLTKRIIRNRRSATRSLVGAVSALNRARVAFAVQTHKKIAATNQRVSASARRFKQDLNKSNAKMAATFKSLDAKLNANARSAARAIGRVNAASRARAAYNLRYMRRALKNAKKRTNRQFSRTYGMLRAQSARADRNLAASSSRLNRALAKHSALTDARFRRTVKKISAARRQASRDVAMASRSFRNGIVGVTATVKNVQSRLQGEINVVSGEVFSNTLRQAMINKKVQKSMKRIIHISNRRWSAAKRARGQLRKVMNANKIAASKMVGALARKTAFGLARVRAQAAAFRRSAARDLSRSTKRMYVSMLKAKLSQKKANRRLAANLKVQKLQAIAAIKAQKRNFATKLANLANTVSANARKQKRKLYRLTGIVRTNKARAAADRALVRRQQRAMQTDLNKSITRSIQIGESKAKAIADRAAKAMKRATATLKSSLSSQIERAADKVFAAVNGNRQKIADNYLSLKAYCVAARFKWNDYRKKAKQPLVSIGDLCVTLGGMSRIVPKAAPGIGLGRKTILPLFGGKVIKGAGAVKKINGLVNEYMQTVTTVRNRWPFGIGKYLLARLEASMQGRGCLEVSKVGRNQAVFINARAVGLSNRLNDFRSLSVAMGTYEAVLAKLTAALAKKVNKARARARVSVTPPEWQGN